VTLAWALLTCVLQSACDPPRRTSDALEVVLPAAPIEIDPRFVLDAQGLRVSRLLFSGLVSLDPYTLEVGPELAERVEVDPSGTVYTVTLKRDLRFSDGTTLDADDVRATYESVLDPDFGSRFSETYRRIQRIETPDPQTVIFVLDGPHAPFMTDLELPIVRREDRDAHLRASDERLAGSGPYELTSATERSFFLRANPAYPRAASHPTVHLLVVRDESTRALRLLGDAVDVAPPFAVAPLLVASFEEDPRFSVRSAPGPGTAYLAFHTGSGALSDVRVRRALSHAIDRPSLMASKFGARAELATGFLPTAHWAHVALDTPGYDPALARRLLDEAGYPEGGDGPRLRLRIRTSTDRTRMAIARAMAAMWAEIGVEVEVRPSETATLLADLDAGRFDIALMTLPEVFEPHVLHWFFASARSEGGPPNRFRFADARFDAALERGRVASVREERFAAYAEAQGILAEALPALPLWHEHVVVIARREIEVRAPSDGRLGFLARP
jgi:peptide/nickel transport system substrate-binding protein